MQAWALLAMAAAACPGTWATAVRVLAEIWDPTTCLEPACRTCDPTAVFTETEPELGECLLNGIFGDNQGGSTKLSCEVMDGGGTTTIIQTYYSTQDCSGKPTSGEPPGYWTEPGRDPPYPWCDRADSDGIQRLPVGECTRTECDVPPYTDHNHTYFKYTLQGECPTHASSSAAASSSSLSSLKATLAAGLAACVVLITARGARSWCT